MNPDSGLVTLCAATINSMFGLIPKCNVVPDTCAYAYLSGSCYNIIQLSNKLKMKIIQPNRKLTVNDVNFSQHYRNGCVVGKHGIF